MLVGCTTSRGQVLCINMASIVREWEHVIPVAVVMSIRSIDGVAETAQIAVYAKDRELLTSPDYTGLVVTRQ